MGFFDEAKAAATTAASQASKLVSGSAVSQSLNSAAQSAQNIKTAISTGLSNVGTSIGTAIPGLISELQGANGVGGVLTGRPELNIKNYAGGAKLDVSDTPPFPNILNSYSSFNYVFTLSVLPDTHINDPDGTYRKGDLGPIIIRSVGLSDFNYEFFIDNVKISGMAGLNQGTGNSNALGLSFQIIEPYSFGLFFQVLQTAALSAGYLNYLDVPILLTIEFKGHIDPSGLNVTIPQSKRMFPMKLRDLQMRVSGKGCTYDVEAYPWNEQAFSDSFNKVKSDINISCNKGGTYKVEDLLKKAEKSLVNVINKWFKDQIKEGNRDYADEIDIEFPDDISSASNSNSTNVIGKAGLGLDLFNKGETPFGKDNFAYDAATGIYKRGNLTIDPNNADFKFAQGATIQDIINQIIMTSDYGRQALKKENWTQSGQVLWWRIETKLFIKPLPEDKKMGKKVKKAVFRVVPYAVDASVFTQVNSKNPGVEEKKQQALKEYNYIYTGKNIDILDFAIEFKAGFYTALNADAGKNSETQKGLSAATGNAGVQKDEINSKNPSGGKPGLNPRVVKDDKLRSRTALLGGTGVDDAATIASRQFHDIVTKGYDMINLNMTILGDPYYITDSGMGNYSAQQTTKENINADGAMDYQTGEVVITVNFRTPIDIKADRSGMYDFGTATQPVVQFSGLFKVLGIESMFNAGKFTQTLSLIRIPNQENTKAPDPVPAEKELPMPETEWTDGSDAQAAIEAANAAEGVEGTPISDQEAEANRAALGDFAG
jgi:hypothetical protein